LNNGSSSATRTGVVCVAPDDVRKASIATRSAALRRDEAADAARVDRGRQVREAATRSSAGGGIRQQYRDPMQIVMLVAAIGSLPASSSRHRPRSMLFLTLFSTPCSVWQGGQAAAAVAALRR